MCSQNRTCLYIEDLLYLEQVRLRGGDVVTMQLYICFLPIKLPDTSHDGNKHNRYLEKKKEKKGGKKMHKNHTLGIT